MDLTIGANLGTPWGHDTDVIILKMESGGLWKGEESRGVGRVEAEQVGVLTLGGRTKKAGGLGRWDGKAQERRVAARWWDAS